MQETEAINVTVNQHIRDVNSRMIFRNAVLCAQFLRDNIDIPILKNVQPEDIRDVTDRYQPFIGVEFESDTVKQIRLTARALEVMPAGTLQDLGDTEVEEVPSIFMISLIEHKSQVDYNISIQVLRYIMCIWTEYGKEMEALKEGCTKTKSFRYPPVLPIVYYEGTQKWSADMHLLDRVWMSEVFKEYLPNFTYQVIRLRDYSDEELLARENAMALIMMINKIQNPQDIEDFFKNKPEQIEHILQKTEEPIKKIISDMFYGLMMKMHMEQEEAQLYAGMLEEGHVGYLFENVEKMDIQAERRNTAEARAELAEVKAVADSEKARADKAEAQLSRMFIAKYQESGLPRREAADKLVEDCEIEETRARDFVDMYWPER